MYYFSKHSFLAGFFFSWEDWGSPRWQKWCLSPQPTAVPVLWPEPVPPKWVLSPKISKILPHFPLNFDYFSAQNSIRKLYFMLKIPTFVLFCWGGAFLASAAGCKFISKFCTCTAISVHSSWGWGWYMILHCKTVIQAEICVAKCLKCGAFCSMIQLNLHPAQQTIVSSPPSSDSILDASSHPPSDSVPEGDRKLSPKASPPAPKILWKNPVSERLFLKFWMVTSLNIFYSQRSFFQQASLFWKKNFTEMTFQNKNLSDQWPDLHVRELTLLN